jgi:hypothetical protein
MSPSDPSNDLRAAQAELLTQLLARVGYAVWQAAECEDSLAHYLVVRLRSARGVGEEKGRDLLEKAQSRTFGHLLKELREKGVLKPELEVRLVGLLDERNWLIHNAKRTNRGVLNDMQIFDALANRIDALATEALELNKLLQQELEEFIVKAGVDRGAIDREADALLKRWGY